MKLGTVVKDSITGFEGTATAFCTYLHGTPRVMVESKRGDKEDSRWYDEQRLVATQG
jgi:hypothetical protein